MMILHFLFSCLLASLLVVVHQADSSVIGVKEGDNNDLQESKLSSEITAANDENNVKSFLLKTLLIAAVQNTTLGNNGSEGILKRSKRFSCWHSCLGPWKLKNPGTKTDKLEDDTKLVTGSPNEDEGEFDDAIVSEERGSSIKGEDGDDDGDDDDEERSTDHRKKKLSPVKSDAIEDGDEERSTGHRKNKLPPVKLDLVEDAAAQEVTYNLHSTDDENENNAPEDQDDEDGADENKERSTGHRKNKLSPVKSDVVKDGDEERSTGHRKNKLPPVKLDLVEDAAAQELTYNLHSTDDENEHNSLEDPDDEDSGADDTEDEDSEDENSGADDIGADDSEDEDSGADGSDGEDDDADEDEERSTGHRKNKLSPVKLDLVEDGDEESSTDPRKNKLSPVKLDLVEDAAAQEVTLNLDSTDDEYNSPEDSEDEEDDADEDD